MRKKTGLKTRNYIVENFASSNCVILINDQLNYSEFVQRMLAFNRKLCYLRYWLIMQC